MLRRNVGVVFQDYKLLPKKTVYENIAYAMQVIGERRRNIKKRVMEVLDLVGLKHKVRSFPNELSGGEQQRVGIVRAIIAQPKILLMDEPFSALDAISRKQLQSLTKSIHDQFGMTTIFVTHDTDEALKLGNRIAVLQDGEIRQVATPEEILSAPATSFVADLFGGVHHV